MEEHLWLGTCVRACGCGDPSGPAPWVSGSAMRRVGLGAVRRQSASSFTKGCSPSRCWRPGSMARESSSSGGGVAWGTRAEQMPPPSPPHLGLLCPRGLAQLWSCGFSPHLEQITVVVGAVLLTPRGGVRATEQACAPPPPAPLPRPPGAVTLVSSLARPGHLFSRAARLRPTLCLHSFGQAEQ